MTKNNMAAADLSIGLSLAFIVILLLGFPPILLPEDAVIFDTRYILFLRSKSTPLAPARRRLLDITALPLHKLALRVETARRFLFVHRPKDGKFNCTWSNPGRLPSIKGKTQFRHPVASLVRDRHGPVENAPSAKSIERVSVPNRCGVLVLGRELYVHAGVYACREKWLPLVVL
jgi:hypothetical protein